MAPRVRDRACQAQPLNNPVGLVDPSGLAPGWRPGGASKYRMPYSQFLQLIRGKSQTAAEQLGNWYGWTTGDKDHKAGRLGDSCSYPGQYTGSCPDGPPDPEYVREAEEDARRKEEGQAARNAAEQAAPRDELEQLLRLLADNWSPTFGVLDGEGGRSLIGELERLTLAFARNQGSGDVDAYPPSTCATRLGT